MKKVLHINTTQSGGAFVAAKRYVACINKFGQGKISAKLLTLEGNDYVKDNIHSLTKNNFFKKTLNNFRHGLEKLFFAFYQKDKSIRFSFSMFNIGIDISNHPLVKEADIIHLHWINKDFLSYKSIHKLLQLNKPIYWTLHDMWLFTGGCHHSRNCNNYLTMCGDCNNYLRNPNQNDLSNKNAKIKALLLDNSNIKYIFPSNWLKNIADKSAILKNKNTIRLVNPIDDKVFYPLNTEDAKKKLNITTNKKLLLFIAANITNPYKGFKFFNAALEELKQNHPTIVEEYALLVVGNVKEDISFSDGYEKIFLGYINQEEKLNYIYNVADVLIFPSLEENLPNTIVEANACGTPTVAFDVGGINEIITSEINGILVNTIDKSILASAIYKQIQKNTDRKSLHLNINCNFGYEFVYNQIEQNYLI